MITNLLSNAFKYGAGKPVDVEVLGDESCARVLDRGIGIPIEKQTIIFERFERAAPLTQYGGFGLGLWITTRARRAEAGCPTSPPAHTQPDATAGSVEDPSP